MKVQGMTHIEHAQARGLMPGDYERECKRFAEAMNSMVKQIASAPPHIQHHLLAAMAEWCDDHLNFLSVNS
jgi:hypothetical protein